MNTFTNAEKRTSLLYLVIICLDRPLRDLHSTRGINSKLTNGTERIFLIIIKKQHCSTLASMPAFAFHVAAIARFRSQAENAAAEPVTHLVNPHLGHTNSSKSVLARFVSECGLTCRIRWKMWGLGLMMMGVVGVATGCHSDVAARRPSLGPVCMWRSHARLLAWTQITLIS